MSLAFCFLLLCKLSVEAEALSERSRIERTKEKNENKIKIKFNNGEDVASAVKRKTTQLNIGRVDNDTRKSLTE